MKRLTLAAPIAMILGALLLAGCGGSSGGGSTESSTTTASTSGGAGSFEISAEDRRCLKEKGVELPGFKSGEAGPPMGENDEPREGGEGGPPPSAGGPIGEEGKKAFEECGVEMPEFKGGPGGPGGAVPPNLNSAAFKKQVREYVACVRENGYELAEPNFAGEGPIFDKSESESEAFKKASEQCQGMLGGPPVKSSAGSTEES